VQVFGAIFPLFVHFTSCLSLLIPGYVSFSHLFSKP